MSKNKKAVKSLKSTSFQTQINPTPISGINSPRLITVFTIGIKMFKAIKTGRPEHWAIGEECGQMRQR
jgi:hypothetical protein